MFIFLLFSTHNLFTTLTGLIILKCISSVAFAVFKDIHIHFDGWRFLQWAIDAICLTLIKEFLLRHFRGFSCAKWCGYPEGFLLLLGEVQSLDSRARRRKCSQRWGRIFSTRDLQVHRRIWYRLDTSLRSGTQQLRSREPTVCTRPPTGPNLSRRGSLPGGCR